MKIGIIGAGGVGGTLGSGFGAAGHEVAYGVREPGSERYEARRGEGARVVGVREAVEFADVVVLATPWAAVEDALAAAGDFEGKPLIDATNPIGPGFVLTHSGDDSGAERVQRLAPSASVVKAFNSTGRENMAQPAYPGGKAVMFVCGGDERASAAAMGLCEDLGFEPVHLGGLERARWVEPLAMVWIRMAIDMGRRDFAFGVLRRED